MDFGRVPPHLHEGLENWIRKGIRPGSFLVAVLSNNLTSAVLRADSVSLASLRDIIFFLVDEAPEGSWGSPKALNEWPLYLAAIERQAEQHLREQGNA